MVAGGPRLEEPGAGPSEIQHLRWQIFAGARRADLRTWHSLSLCSADASGELCGVDDWKGAESSRFATSHVGFFHHLPHAMTADVGGERRLVRRRDLTVKSRCNHLVRCARSRLQRRWHHSPDGAQEVIAGASQSNPSGHHSTRGFSYHFHSLLGQQSGAGVSPSRGIFGNASSLSTCVRGPRLSVVAAEGPSLTQGCLTDCPTRLKEVKASLKESSEHSAVAQANDLVTGQYHFLV